MPVLKHILQALMVIGIALAIAADVKFDSKKVRVMSGILAIVAAIGFWTVDIFSKTTISEISGTATIAVQWEGANKDWRSFGFENSSAIEFYIKGKCVIRIGSSKTSTFGIGENLALFKNDYSTSVRGSFINAKMEDIQTIDSIVVYDSDFRSPLSVDTSIVELRINGENYYVVENRRSINENKRINLGKIKLSLLKTDPHI